MFKVIEGPWPRREHFAHYMHTLRCTFSLTVNVDVTRLRAELKRRGLKAYPAQIYLLATAVNRLPEFCMGLSAEGEPGHWDVMHPSYTVFNAGAKTFASIWTPYEKGFAAFYEAARRDMQRYAGATAFEPKPGMPPNVFNISSIPWVDFTAFNLNVYGDGAYLAPIFTLGKYVEEGGKTLLPLAMQLHHAACDGYHAGLLVELVRELADDCEGWL